VSYEKNEKSFDFFWVASCRTTEKSFFGVNTPLAKADVVKQSPVYVCTAALKGIAVQ
jgi:hypothetical protein